MFKFTTRHATRTQCALATGSGRAKFAACSSPKAYRGLGKGHYTFLVRALGPGGISAPARETFQIS
jgi:hypothetical protein